jgi:hypothetical protein
MSRLLLYNSGGTNGVATGAILTGTVSLIDAVAAGAANASGATLVVFASTIAGTATGDVPIVLPIGGGSFRHVRSRVRYLDEEQDAVAPSAIVSSRVVLIAGTATGSAVAAAADEAENLAAAALALAAKQAKRKRVAEHNNDFWMMAA